MNFFIRLWYSIYEFIAKKSAYKGSPLGGVSLLMTFLLCFAEIAVKGYWSCLSVVAPVVPSPFMPQTRLQAALIITPLFFMFLFFNKKVGTRWVGRFQDESSEMRRKRHKEALMFSIGYVCFFAGWVIWKWSQP